MAWDIVVGLETHTQLLTRSKIFSGAPTAFGAAPNTQASAVDIALPGVLPVLNRAAVELALRFGLAVGAAINRRSVFARKNYFYPDLPKGYQISQYELPIVQGGSLKVALAGGEKTIRLTRAHLEEDAGKSLHEDFRGMTGIDLNRAGTPLLEIVSEPEMASAAEAVAYARTLHALVRWIGICDGNMQEGSFRCDANVSVRRPGAPLGTRCEIKNLNSFRFMEQAIEFEAARQIGILEDGGAIVQETRLYDPERGETRSMRSKEDAHDYRYFPDPDLPPLVVNEVDIERIRAQMPELPEAVRDRLMQEHGLSGAEARSVTASREMAKFFASSTSRLLELDPAKWGLTGTGPADARRMYGGAIAKGIMGLLAAQLNRDELEIGQAPVSPSQFAVLHSRLIDNTLTAKSAREVFHQIWESRAQGEHAIDEIIREKGLTQISDLGLIEKLVDEVLAANPKQVADYRAGKDKAFNSLVGQVMKASRGKANPQQVADLLRSRLGG